MSKSTRVRMLSLLSLLTALLCCHPARALNPAIALQDLNHTSWTEKDGVPADIQSMAQTRDGWLWLSTVDGLYRFDGVRFERVPLPRNSIYNLHAQENGDLLISYMLEGMSILHPDGKLTDLNDPDTIKLGGIGAMTVDRDGVLWVMAPGGLYRRVDGKWQTMVGGLDWASDGYSMLIDQYGRLWASNHSGLWLHDRASDKVRRIEGEHLNGSLIQSPDGRIWIASSDAVRPVPAPPTSLQLPRQPDMNQSESRWAGQFDRDGTLWALRCPYGICRVPNAGNLKTGLIVPSKQARDTLQQNQQLLTLATVVTLEDREGNIWVATQSGLDRFRENKLIPVRIPGPSGVYSTASDTEGRLWVAERGNNELWQVRPDAAPVRDTSRTVTVLANDRDGALLLAGPRTIERIYKGRSSTIALPPAPDGKLRDLAVLGVLDDGKVLWMASFQTGLMGLVDGKWLPRATFHLPARIYMSAPGGTGQLWLSHNDGKLDFYDSGKLTGYDIGMVGMESGIFPGPQLVVAGERGIAVLRGRQFALLGEPDREALHNVTGMAVTPDGDRWLNGAKGVVHVRRDDWEAAVRDPAQPLVYDVINLLDGYPGRAAMDNRLPTVYNAGNGRLWFRATGGLVRLETADLRPNPVKPNVQILALNTDGASYPAGAALRLPPDSSSFNIQYTAPGLRKPEGMRFQYLLEGLDRQWQDAGLRRAAYYTNVGPGAYRFKVRAVNEDGVVSDAVASLAFEVAPTLSQTWWFRALCALGPVGVAYGLYRYRVRAVTARVARQLQVRMDERERIARTLHDTFLQSVQALILRVHLVMGRLPEDSPARAALDAALDQASRTIEEGRDQVHELRSGHDDTEQLLDLTGRALAANSPATSFSLVVSGTRRSLKPPVQDEVSEVGREALRNAFQHAGAGGVEVRLEYGSDFLLLQVVDNGKGLDHAEMEERARERHFGVVGMRERAQRIGAAIALCGTPGSGTMVELKVPARLAYD